MKFKFKKYSIQNNNLKFKKIVPFYLKKISLVVLKSKLVYFVLIVLALVFYRSDVKRRIVNNHIVPIAYNHISPDDSRKESKPCNIPLNTVEYDVLSVDTGEMDANTYLSSKENSCKKTTNLLNIDNMSKACGNTDGIAYTIEEFNLLDIKELKKFYGVGEATAKAIIDLRESRGGFKSFEELLDVKGIGPVKWKKIMGGEYEKETD